MTIWAWRGWTIALVAAALVLSPGLAWGGTLTIGSISTEAAAEIKRFLPVARYLAERLRGEGVAQGKVVVARSIPEMGRLLREGKVDLYIDSPFPALAVSRLSGSKVFLRRWKKGVAEYHTVIFTRRDSGIERLADLRGRIISFEEPFSTSGYFVPKAIMLQQGLRMTPKKDPSGAIGPGEIGYVFSYGDETTMVWVLKGMASAGAMEEQT